MTTTSLTSRPLTLKPTKPLSAEGQEFMRGLVSHGVLSELDRKEIENLIDPEGGVLLNICGDGARGKEACHYFDQLVHDVCPAVPLIHEFKINGGPLILAPDSPFLRYPGADLELIQQFRDTAEIMAEEGIRLRTRLLHPHVPCGQGRLLKQSLVDIFRMAHSAKCRVKRTFANTDVKNCCFFHVQYADGPKPMKTLFFNREAWEDWAFENRVVAHWSRAA